MKSPRLHPSLLLAPALAFVLFASARAEEAPTTIKFSDPAKPGTVKISLGRGELRVQGADTNEVSVKSEAKAITSKPRKDGLRVLSAASSFSLNEKDNVVTVDAAANDFGRGSGDFRLTVPRNTTIIVQNAWGGDISCSGISGDIEINNMHGEIRLDDVAGGIVVGTMNGEIRASIRELHEGKPLNFTSMNGEVVLRLPADAKANVRLRTQNGSVLTDFDEAALVTKTENSPGIPRGRNTFNLKNEMNWKTDKVLTVEIQNAIREAAQVSATAVKEALEAVKEGFEASKLDMEEASQKLQEAKKEIERAKRDADRARRDADRERERTGRVGRTGDAPAAARAPGAPSPEPAPGATPAQAAKPPSPMAPMSPKIPIPTITGGKLVTGTLNGGGPEISVSTMNGDVTIRKLEAKK